MNEINVKTAEGAIQFLDELLKKITGERALHDAIKQAIQTLKDATDGNTGNTK